MVMLKWLKKNKAKTLKNIYCVYFMFAFPAHWAFDHFFAHHIRMYSCFDCNWNYAKKRQYRNYGQKNHIDGKTRETKQFFLFGRKFLHTNNSALVLFLFVPQKEMPCLIHLCACVSYTFAHWFMAQTISANAKYNVAAFLIRY